MRASHDENVDYASEKKARFSAVRVVVRTDRELRLHNSRLPLLTPMESTTQRACALVLLLLATACSGSVDSGVGDPAVKPVADTCGGGDRLGDLMGPATWLIPGDKESKSCSYPLDRSVSLSGLRIVAIDRYDETGEGATGNYYAQDACAAPAPFQGMTVYAPSFSPPDMRLFPGDVVDLLGNLMEFKGPSTAPFPYCRTLPEIGGTLTFRFEMGAELNPITIPLLDMKSYDTARQWLGMLVRVENVTISDKAYDSNGRYSAPMDVGGGIPLSEVPSISNELFDMKSLGPPLAEGVKFKSVTGIVTYFYGFKIAPRSAEDFEL